MTLHQNKKEETLPSSNAQPSALQTAHGNNTIDDSEKSKIGTNNDERLAGQRRARPSVTKQVWGWKKIIL